MKKLIAIVVILILIFLAFYYFPSDEERSYVAPTTDYSDSSDLPNTNYDKYKVLTNEACYNDEGVEVQCKG